jgi:hypothetical protein
MQHPSSIRKVVRRHAGTSRERQNDKVNMQNTLRKGGAPQHPVCDSPPYIRVEESEPVVEFEKEVKRGQRRGVALAMAKGLARFRLKGGCGCIESVISFVGKGAGKIKGDREQGEADWCRPVTVTEAGKEWRVDVEAVRESKRNGEGRRV